MGILDKISQAIGRVTNEIHNAPQLQAVIQPVHGALYDLMNKANPPQPVNKNTDVWYQAAKRTSTIPQISSLYQQAPLASPNFTPLPINGPSHIQLISRAYGSLQPSGAPQYEDAPLDAQALQNPGYPNQTSFNGQFIQGSRRGYGLPLYLK